MMMLKWLCLPGRHNVIRSEAARERAELGRQYHEHRQCGRRKMGNTVYIGKSSLLKKAYINCNCIYEVGFALIWQAVLRTLAQGFQLLPSADISRHGVVRVYQAPYKLAGRKPYVKAHPQADVTGMMHGAVRERLPGAPVRAEQGGDQWHQRASGGLLYRYAPLFGLNPDPILALS